MFTRLKSRQTPTRTQRTTPSGEMPRGSELQRVKSVSDLKLSVFRRVIVTKSWELSRNTRSGSATVVQFAGNPSNGGTLGHRKEESVTSHQSNVKRNLLTRELSSTTSIFKRNIKFSSVIKNTWSPTRRRVVRYQHIQLLYIYNLIYRRRTEPSHSALVSLVNANLCGNRPLGS